MKEPLIHSHILDVLPDSHPLSGSVVVCDRCEASLHMSNNECMQTWVETGIGNFCLKCFCIAGGATLEDNLALKD
jgi:hypothetical protein